MLGKVTVCVALLCIMETRFQDRCAFWWCPLEDSLRSLTIALCTILYPPIRPAAFQYLLWPLYLRFKIHGSRGAVLSRIGMWIVAVWYTTQPPLEWRGSASSPLTSHVRAKTVWYHSSSNGTRPGKASFTPDGPCYRIRRLLCMEIVTACRCRCAVGAPWTHNRPPGIVRARTQGPLRATTMPRSSCFTSCFCTS
ncbi:hypothetical protein C8Q77DRAFT_1112651 [Trametes polyzona]|nr:hypothetical protein C8Q77DRAFT_1112651 [Trametes polyzona]